MSIGILALCALCVLITVGIAKYGSATGAYSLVIAMGVSLLTLALWGTDSVTAKIAIVQSSGHQSFLLQLVVPLVGIFVVATIGLLQLAISIGRIRQLQAQLQARPSQAAPAEDFDAPDDAAGSPGQ